ncbi:MAG: type II secretion system protein GspL [Blastomonas sp.]
MTGPTGLVVTIAADEEAPLYWWRAENGLIVARGNDYSPPEFDSEASDFTIMALLPAGDTMIRTLDMQAMPAAQAETAARLQVTEDSIGPNLHVATRSLAGDEGQSLVLTATIAAARMAERLEQLTLRGIDPDVMLPVGLLLDGQAEHRQEARYGDLAAARRGMLIAPGGDPLVEQLMTDADPHVLDQRARDATLLAALADPPINLRQGEFARREPLFDLEPRQKRLLGWIVAALVLLSLAVPLLEIVRLHWAAGDAEDRALAEARTLVPEAQTVEQAEQLLNRKMASRGAGTAIASAPISALLSSLQPVSGASLREMGYRSDGMVNAIIAAPRTEDINQVLLVLQQNGFVVTATPRQDASGSALADITVRAR